jgi:hypothetical protein
MSQMFVYTKMNHWLLQFDGVHASSEQLEYAFQSVPEFVDDMIERELAAHPLWTPATQDVDLAASMRNSSSENDVEDW